MQVNPHIITLYYIIKLYICIYALPEQKLPRNMKNGNSSYVAKLSAETMKTTFDLELERKKRERERERRTERERERRTEREREREWLHAVTDRQCSCLLGSVLGPVGTVLPDISVLTFPKVFGWTLWQYLTKAIPVPATTPWTHNS